jgi:uroporphyrin-III C-methyltransferase/precorrin-2 dehydrogenase/sirohydrochlorin ferrochelatase
VSFVTGHAGDGGDERDWRALAMTGTTAVFYMGLARLDRIVRKLLEHGAAASRPVAIVAQGTTANQRVLTATLATIRDVASAADLKPPALLVVGEVVALHATLNWFNAPGRIDLSEIA